MSNASDSDLHMLKGIARKIGTDADIIARVLLDVLQREARREKPAEKPDQETCGHCHYMRTATVPCKCRRYKKAQPSQPQPGAGVDKHADVSQSPKVVASRIGSECTELGDRFSYARCERIIAEHDASITAAARDKAIDEAIAILFSHGWLEGSPAVDALRTLKEHA